MLRFLTIHKHYALIAGLLLLLSGATYAQDIARYKALPIFPDTSIVDNDPMVDETGLRYSRHVLNRDFDFELKAISQGKFKLNVLKDTKAMVSIRVYDVIGNLLHEENVKIRGSFAKEFDLSFLKTRFFIVEIGNQDFNKTKSIVAT